MTDVLFKTIIDGIKKAEIVPYLGPGGLNGSVSVDTGEPIPADSDSLIYAMNGGKPMAPKLMFEFPRAAMNLELKKGRTFITRFLTDLYETKSWTRAPLHDWLASVKPSYVIDINRDLQLQDSYNETPHTLVRGIARLGGTEFRYQIHHFDGESYKAIPQEMVDPTLPILFKPHGSPRPDANYVASDADFVDYITELMGGFSIPHFLKDYRQGKQYLFLGMRFSRDTERMVMSDIVYSSKNPIGWAVIPDASDKEKRFMDRVGIELIEADVSDFLSATGDLAKGAAA